MAAALKMLHLRSMRDPSPYYSTRIAFLDQWFMSSWVLDYKTWDPKTSELSTKYMDMLNGRFHRDAVTNKKWFIDIDHVYGCHHIKGDHWIALDIDLQKSRIHVYDSITDHADDKFIQDTCKPFSRMIPHLLNMLVPYDVRKKTEKQFTVLRRKNIPQNDKPGDCGVYTIKYIECLALGCIFEGLEDRYMQQMRLKLAVDLFKEVPDVGGEDKDGIGGEDGDDVEEVTSVAK